MQIKKIIAILVICLCVGTALSAQDSGMSFGGGAFLDMSFRNGVSTKIDDYSGYYGIRNISFGGYGFFDITYAEIDVSFAYGSLTNVVKIKDIVDINVNGSTDGGSVLQLGISLLGKYPIKVGSITVFPLFGLGYNIVLSMKNANGDNYKDSGESAMKDLSQFAILGGGGLDYNINKNFYLRASALLQVRFPSKGMRDLASLDNDAKATLGFGPVVKVGVGYRF